MKDVKVLVVDDNKLVLDLIVKGLEPHCDVRTAGDGADALLKIVDEPADLVLCDYRMPGLDGRQLYEKLRTRFASRPIPFIFLANRSDIEEKLRPMVEGVEEFITKPFFVQELVRRAKKVIDRLQLEKLQKTSARPGVIQGRLEEMSMLDLMQSIEMGQKTCKLTVRNGGNTCQIYFAGGQCQDAKLGKIEGESAVYETVRWAAGEFEIDFN
ncbi:MAG TPA: response regulator, partial [Candidatus Acidoferrales bacterium]|nr:response regulator [Candidatus Acidoferrales bacterium]